jgi:hypothetical protein
MKTIHKYPLATADEIEIAMPADAELLCVREQYGTPCLWALVNTSKPSVFRRLRMVGTGHNLDDVSTRKYVGTVFEAGGQLVWHVFDDGESAS